MLLLRPIDIRLHLTTYLPTYVLPRLSIKHLVHRRYRRYVIIEINLREVVWNDHTTYLLSNYYQDCQWTVDNKSVFTLDPHCLSLSLSLCNRYFRLISIRRKSIIDMLNALKCFKIILFQCLLFLCNFLNFIKTNIDFSSLVGV